MILARHAALAALVAAAAAAPSADIRAGESPGDITSPVNPAVPAPFDILEAHAHRDGMFAVFGMSMEGKAGAELPVPAGGLGGAPVLAYVWPTSLDSGTVGFPENAGILALTATSHPDFDDTPLFDEDADGDTNNDGARWHSHWVVLAPDDTCAPGALKVADIPDGASPPVPTTWPGLPLMIDSPGYTPVFDGPRITLRIPAAALGGADGVNFDGVTAALKVHADVHAPLLCVTAVSDIASGDLSLPGSLR